VAKQVCAPIYADRKKLLNQDGGKLLDRAREELVKQRQKLENIESNIEKIVEEQGRAIDARWNAHKTDIVPGDALLDEVCKQFGVRFNKERDSVRLAGLMKPEDIPSEIQALLKDLCSH
jgi:hypothetical protein